MKCPAYFLGKIRKVSICQRVVKINLSLVNTAYHILANSVDPDQLIG